jgi:small-conductance mechanosensitive channel
MRDSLRDQIEAATDQIIDLAVGLAEATIVFGLAWILHRWLRGPIRRRIAAMPIPENTKGVIGNGATVLVYLFAFTLLLGLWGGTWQTFITAISVGTLVVALGLQDILRSVVGGLFIAFEQPFNVGDQVKVRDVVGRVESVGIRKITILTEEGDLVSTPNALIFSDPITNQSPYRTVRTRISVSSFKDEPADLKAATLEALAGVPGLATSPDITVRMIRPKFKVPRDLPGFDVFDREPQAKTRAGTAKGHQMQIAWTGSGAPAVRDEVVRRLKAAFPEAAVRVQRR